jgi:hypothetical protein
MAAQAQIVITALDKLSGPLLNMSVRLEAFNKQMQKTSQVSQALGLFTEQMKPSLDRVNKAFNGVKDGTKTFAAFTVAVGGAGFGLMKFATSAVDAIDKVGDLAARYQVATTSIQVWGGLVEEAGGDMDSAAKGIGKLRGAMNEAIAGSAQYVAAFDGIGISVQQLQNMKPEDVMLRMADAFKASNNENAKHAVLTKLMGERATAFMDVMNQGGDAVRQRYADMRADGRLFTDEHIQQADAFDKAWKRATGAFDGIKNTLGMDLANALMPIIDATRKWLLANRELVRDKFATFIQHLPGILENVWKAAQVVWDIFSGIASVFKTLGHILGPTVTVFLAIGLAMAPLIVSVISLTTSLYGLGAAVVAALGPVGLAIAALAAIFIWLGTVVYENWDAIVATISGAWQRIKSVFEVNFFAGLFQAWLEMWQGLANGILGIIKSIPFVRDLDAVKNLQGLNFANQFASAVTPITAAQAAGNKQQIDNTLRIKIDSEGRPRVTEMKSGAGQTRFDVSTGLVMAGG